MRLFIAIQLSDEMKKALVACMHDLKIGDPQSPPS